MAVTMVSIGEPGPKISRTPYWHSKPDIEAFYKEWVQLPVPERTPD